jgi:putative flippase GtrA
MKISRVSLQISVLRQMSQFGLVGIATVCVDLTVYNLAVYLGIITPVSKALSFIAGVTMSYVGNSNLTFRKQKHKRSRFLMTYGFSLFLNVSINEIFLYLILSGYKYALISSWLVATGVSGLFNFLTLRKWVFDR